ncbi:MAG: hypothetical protein FJ148_23510 [Deltaproteobacteria bacterium]|nr:hypothetical protein [Actinomycetota bacterium]MBM4246724.1 hypothetical protein [Deltaproteobacteria bacterium]
MRRAISKILTFSYGTHYCIGAAAARLQGRVVLEELLRRCPDFRVDVAAGRYADGNYVRRHLTLPWRADAGAGDAGGERGPTAAPGSAV